MTIIDAELTWKEFLKKLREVSRTERKALICTQLKLIIKR